MKLLITTIGVLIIAQQALTQQALALTEDQNRATGNRTETFQVERDGRLDLNTRAGDITISTWSKNEAVVNVQGVPASGADDLRIRYEGGILRVDYDSRRWSMNRSRGLRFKIDLPSDFDLDLRTGGGDIEVVGNLGGDVRSHTSGGDVTLRDIGGDVELTTSGGDIRVGTVGGDVHLQTSGGDIRVEKASADLDVQTSGGDIRIGHVGNELEAQTSGGDITIEYVGGKSRIRTSGGDIEIGELLANARITTSGGDIELRDAKGELQVKTAGGELELLNVTGSIDARTAGGEILAEITPEGSKGSSLISAGGDVVLYVDPEAKATIEARIRVDKKSRFGVFQMSPLPGSDAPIIIDIPEIPMIDTDQAVTKIDEEELKEIIEKLTRSVNEAVQLSAEEAQRLLQELQRDLRTAQRELQAAQRKSVEAQKKMIQNRNTVRSSLRYNIRSDFEAERYDVDADEGEISATYTLNGGGARIWVETSDSNIEIRELNK
ncbi:MAG: DUF4097 family beta strand repeat-containing protein [Gemmatimonadetes bacterium]|nr:DUF4097 family beta strand repeat-containing protein [Gemmatimonadota bacterium]